MLCFLPVLYAAIRSRSQKNPVQLPTGEQEPASGTKQQKLHGWGYLLLWAPALCDLTGTTLMNVGLLYTPVSIYQMTRGSVVLFVGVLSVIFLRRHLWFYQWFSLLTVMSGVALVGFSGSLVKDVVKQTINALLDNEPTDTPEASKVVLGVFFVLFAQVFTASQFVIEEKIMARYSIAPLVAVGYEGLFGTLSILIFMPVMSLWASRSMFFDLPRGWRQMVDNPPVLYSGLIIALSIAFFNFFGLSVTRHVSANSRGLTDTCRTLSIWLISLGLGWEKFVWPISLLQVAGFGLLVYGTLLFNNLVTPLPFLKHSVDLGISAEEDQAILVDARDEQQSLLAEEALEETAVLPADIGQSGFDVLPERQRR
jgi:drug/metabolite transporter (DMT)-like permease